MPFSSNVILLDQSGFTYYRVIATLNWAAKNDVKPCLDNIEFVKVLISQYFSDLNRFLKQLQMDFDIIVRLDQIYSVLDCKGGRHQVWRRFYYPFYEIQRYEKRESDTSVNISDIMNYVYTKTEQYFGKNLKAESAEVDDVVSVVTKMAQEYIGMERIIIASPDRDFQQLLSDPRVFIYNSNNWTRITCDNPLETLTTKVQNGGVFCLANRIHSVGGEYYYGFLLSSQLVDFDYVPRNIQDNIVHSLNFSEAELPSNYRPRPIQLGLCCINMGLRDQNIFCSRKPIIRTIKDKGLVELISKCHQNVRDLIRLIDWNGKNGIRVLRISSDLFPHYANHRVEEFGPQHSSLDYFQPMLTQAGRLARYYRQRLTFHPGQYNVVGTPDFSIFQNTARDLDYHAEVLDRMGMDQDSVMVVHGGGQYKNKRATMERWIQQFRQLSTRVQRRLVLENCEKNFHIEDCLYISQHTGVPVVFDTHHYICYRRIHPDVSLQFPEFYIPKILETWTRRGIKPKFHISEQGKGQIGNHSDYVQCIPNYLLEIPQKYSTNIDIMIEAKMKERAIQYLYLIYPHLNPLNLVTNNIKVITNYLDKILKVTPLSYIPSGGISVPIPMELDEIIEEPKTHVLSDDEIIDGPILDEIIEEPASVVY